MDIGRTSYRRAATFFRDSNVAATIKWYRAPEGAKFFPVPHKWGSLWWYTNPWSATGVGENFDGVPRYSLGFTPPTVTGQNFCGRLEDFQLGAVYNPANVTLRDVWGVALCCGLPDPNVMLTQGDQGLIMLTESGDWMAME